MSRSHTGGPTRSPGAKAWIGHAQLSTVGRAALGPRPQLRKSQRRRRLCLQRSCPTLTPRKGHDTKPCSLPTGHLGCWCPGLTAPLSHVLPTVGDDHLLLGLPVLAAMGLCGPNRRGGIRGGRLESKWVPALPTPSQQQQQPPWPRLQVPGLLLPLSQGCAPGARVVAPHVCAHRCQPFRQAGSDSGTYRLLDALSSTQLIVNGALSMVVSIILYWFVISLIHSTNTYYFITRHLLNPGDTGPSLGGAHSLAEKSHSQIINSSQECKVDLLSKNQINRIKDKNHIIILIDAEKNPIPFQNKNIQ